MTDEELQELGEKVVSGTASKEESLRYVQKMNALLEELKEELKK